MSSHNGTNHNTALHVMAWHRVPWRVSRSFSRGLGRSGVAAPCPAPWAPRKAPHEAGLMESTRWLCFQHRLLKAETGLPADTSSKRRRPKVGGGLLRPKKSTNRPQMCNHFQCFFWWAFSRFGALWKDRKRPRCSGSTFWNNQRRRNGASAAAGATF